MYNETTCVMTSTHQQYYIIHTYLVNYCKLGLIELSWEELSFWDLLYPSVLGNEREGGLRTEEEQPVSYE